MNTCRLKEMTNATLQRLVNVPSVSQEAVGPEQRARLGAPKTLRILGEESMTTINS